MKHFAKAIFYLGVAMIWAHRGFELQTKGYLWRAACVELFVITVVITAFTILRERE
jgi:hypothetical protein